MKEKVTPETEFLERYRASDYVRPNSSVDVVIFSYFEQSLHVLTVKRTEHPFKDRWSLVGGFVDLKNDLTLEDTAKRKLLEKTGVSSPFLEQLETIGNAHRDPRGWSITTVYFALLPAHSLNSLTELCAHRAGTKRPDTLEVRWTPVKQGQVDCPLAFDHKDIVKKSWKRFSNKAVYTSLPVHLMPETFTLGELQQVYEVILDKGLDPKSFRRRVLNADFLEPTGEVKTGPTRPAALYRLKRTLATHYFVRNFEVPSP